MVNGKNFIQEPYSTKAIKDIIRHHLERTTGGSGKTQSIIKNHQSVILIRFTVLLEYDGLILSPTREKLEPTIPKKNDENSKSKDISLKSSPKKDSTYKTLNKKNNQKSNTKPVIRTSKSSFYLFYHLIDITTTH